jgi:hypothetical protein
VEVWKEIVEGKAKGKEEGVMVTQEVTHRALRETEKEEESKLVMGKEEGSETATGEGNA